MFSVGDSQHMAKFRLRMFMPEMPRNTGYPIWMATAAEELEIGDHGSGWWCPTPHAKHAIDCTECTFSPHIGSAGCVNGRFIMASKYCSGAIVREGWIRFVRVDIE